MATMFGVNTTAVISMLSTDLAAAIAQGAWCKSRLAGHHLTLLRAQVRWRAPTRRKRWSRSCPWPSGASAAVRPLACACYSVRHWLTLQAAAGPAAMNGTAAAPLVTALAGSAQSISPAVVLALMQGMGSLLG